MKKGFTFLELILVITCISLIALIVLPVFAGAKMSANEAFAVENMRTYYKAQHTYRSIHACPSTFGLTPNLLNEGLIEQEFADAILSAGGIFYYGYAYAEGLIYDYDGYLVYFDLESGPETYNVDGRKQFYMNYDGVILYRDNGQDNLPGYVGCDPPIAYDDMVCTYGWQMLPFPSFP